jgi:hypothetical protein
MGLGVSSGADDVEATGMVMRQWGRDCPGARCDVEIVLLANGLVRLNRQASIAAPDAGSAAQRCFRTFWAASGARPLAWRNRIVSRCGWDPLDACSCHGACNGLCCTQFEVKDAWTSAFIIT